MSESGALWQGKRGVERSDGVYGLTKHLPHLAMADHYALLTPKSYGREHVGFYMWLRICRWGASEGDLYVSDHCLWFQKGARDYTRHHAAECEVRRRAEFDRGFCGDVECPSVNATVLVEIPGQVQEVERGSTCFTGIPSDVWLVKRDVLDLVGSQAMQTGWAPPGVTTHLKDELVAGNKERKLMPPTNPLVVHSEKRANEMVQRASCVVDEISEHRTEVGPLNVRQPNIDDLVALIDRIDLLPQVAFTFRTWADYGVQGCEVFSCSVDFGPDAAQIEGWRHG